MSTPVCLVENITKFYGDYLALDNVSLELYEKEIFGLLGSNGAGKSTLIKIMTSLLEADKGNVAYFGLNLDEKKEEIKKLFAVVPQEISCYHGFSVEQNIRFFGLMYGIKAEKLEERTKYLLDWFQLSDFSGRPVNELSGGYKRLLNIACSLVHDPKIVFLDEPTVGLDPTMRRLLWKKIYELKEQGKTICITTHYLDEAQSLCNRVGLLVNGKLIVVGEPFELIKKYGGVRILVMKLSHIIMQDHAEAIKNSFEDSQVEVQGSTIIISFSQEHSIEKISLLTQWLENQGYEVISSIIKEPELEDVFLNLTGERMKE
ncbi:MAG: ABC transporter ATP-binding protein [Candidatus Diapherotrites archaeon]